jgi:polyhydroxyalkanoate synthesis repressor PhaR
VPTPRTIKKYPNRRLYDTHLSRYITLADVRKLVREGTEFKVIDANTDEDLTRSILLQIILDQEGGAEPLFSTEALSQMIRFYGDTVQGVFGTYLEKSLTLFKDQQDQIREQLKDAYTANPFNLMAEMTQRNLQLWKELQDTVFGAAVKSPQSNKARGKPD